MLYDILDSIITALDCTISYFATHASVDLL